MKKKIIVAATVGALTMAAGQALALEHQFNGSYRLKAFVSNSEFGDGGFIVTPKSQTAANYFEQRTRLLYTAKANDNLKLVTAFEIDTVWGDKQQGGIDTATGVNPGTAYRNSGGAMDTDAVNLETKWMALNFDIPSTPVNVTAGLQAYKDSLKGIFLDADLAGIMTKTKFGPATVNVAYFRPYELLNTATRGANAPRGTDNLDIGVLEGTFSVNKDLTVGAAYYLYADNRLAKPIEFHTFGMNASATVGPATISGFAAYQGGYAHSSTFGQNASVTKQPNSISAFAANVAAKVKAGPGTAKATFLYTSGDGNTRDTVDHSWQSAQYTTYGTFAAPALNAYSSAVPAANTFNESAMMLLNRNAAAGGTTTDKALMYSTSNKGQGSTIFAVGYDAPISPKLYVNANLGMGMTSSNNQNHPLGARATGNQFIGTEINTEVGYKLYDNLTASFQAAYVFLGDYYDPKGQDKLVNPYTTRLSLAYAF